MLLRLLLAITLLALPATVRADWYEAQSDHFVIYADDSERDVRRFAEMLERYHAAMAFLTGNSARKPSPSNRVTVYVVGSERNLRRLHGEKNSEVAGFYIPRAGGAVAFVPRLRSGGRDGDFSLTVLLHEYAHHFLLTSTAASLPRWADEGGAEFFAASKFDDDGAVTVGVAARHRGYELFKGKFDIEPLLDPEAFADHQRGNEDGFYGKSWALYHYLTFSRDRPGQLAQYLDEIISGVPLRDAATNVFGDFDELGSDLYKYIRQRRLSALPDWSRKTANRPDCRAAIARRRGRNDGCGYPFKARRGP